MRELISSRLRLEYGTDESGKSKGVWTFSKVLPNAAEQQVFALASGLNALQENDDAKIYRIVQYQISK